MKRERIFILGILVLFSFTFISAELGYNTRDSGVRNINQNLTQLFTTVNGSNINASSFSTQCSGTDKVINVTYSNFSGLFTIVCDTDETSAGGLTWANIINGTVYLSNNTYGFYNSTTLPASNEVFWNANLTAHNSTWNSINNATYNEAWLLATNGTFYKRITNEYNYTNKTLLSQFTNDLTFYVDNTHNYTNFTKLSDFTNDLTFYIDNSHGYWNDTYATFNKTYADTLYYSISNPSSYITLTQYFSNATSQFYPLNSNPYSYINTTSEPLWSANYTLYNVSWSTTFNQTYQDAWLYTTNNSFYPYTSNPFGYLNTSADSFVGNYSNFSNVYAFVVNGTFLKSFTESDPLAYNGTLAYLSTLQNGTYTATYNATYDAYNSTGLIRDWNNTGLIKNWGALTEVDPYWSDNFTKYNSTWSRDTGNTTAEIWAVVYNGTFYLDSNPKNFTNKTLLSQFTNDLTFYIDNSHGYYNQSNFNITDYLLTSNKTLNGNYSATDFCLTDGSKCLTGITGTIEVDPYFSANLTAHNSTWVSTYNATYDAYNSTGLIINWNNTGYIQNWNASSLIKNWQTDINSANTTLYNWVVAQSYTAGGITWANAVNGTLATWTQAMNGTLLKQTTYDTNYSTLAKLPDANVFTVNNTFEGFKFEGDTTNHIIYDNATCIFIKGDTSVIEIC